MRAQRSLQTRKLWMWVWMFKLMKNTWIQWLMWIWQWTIVTSRGCRQRQLRKIWRKLLKWSVRSWSDLSSQPSQKTTTSLMCTLPTSTSRQKTANSPSTKCLSTSATKQCSRCSSNPTLSSNPQHSSLYKPTSIGRWVCCRNCLTNKCRGHCHQLRTPLSDSSTSAKWTSPSKSRVCCRKMCWHWTSNIFWIRCICSFRTIQRTAWSKVWILPSTG